MPALRLGVSGTGWYPPLDKDPHSSAGLFFGACGWGEWAKVWPQSGLLGATSGSVLGGHAVPGTSPGPAYIVHVHERALSPALSF